MSLWKIIYWNDEKELSSFEKWFKKLTQNQAKSVSKELFLLKAMGNELRLPHSKALGKGLFELRERSYGYRIYYGFQENYLIILLAAGNKKSQEKDIKIAHKRLAQLLEK